jgi:hypothetical protein
MDVACPTAFFDITHNRQKLQQIHKTYKAPRGAVSAAGGRLFFYFLFSTATVSGSNASNGTARAAAFNKNAAAA